MLRSPHHDLLPGSLRGFTNADGTIDRDWVKIPEQDRGRGIPRRWADNTLDAGDHEPGQESTL